MNTRVHYLGSLSVRFIPHINVGVLNRRLLQINITFYLLISNWETSNDTMKKLIAVTGTPGTGKTVIARSLSRELGANLMDVNALIRKKQLRYTVDRVRNTKIVDINDLQKAVSNNLKEGVNIIDSHLSHLLKSHFIVVLRCNPAELVKRLKKKNWKEAKIRENVEAELIGVISAEACRKQHVIEIDTTNRKPSTVVAEIIKKLGTEPAKRQINWLKPDVLLKINKVLK